MNNNYKTISDIYGITIESTEKICPTEIWYINLLKKKPQDINMRDITKMLIHKIFLEIAIEKSLQILSEDYMAGKFYDGHLLKLLSSIELSEYKNQIDNMKLVMNKINNMII